jgi:lipid-binding SYLF domain-containing protein
MAKAEKKTKVSFHRGLVVLLLAAILLTTSCARPKGANTEDKREYARDMRDKTLKELYEKKPEAKAKVEKAAGYGVFSDLGVNIILVSAGQGYGVVVDNETKKETFMNMAQVGVGLGLGVKDFRAVFIFRSEEALQKFVVSGWEFGAHADAAAVSGEKGGQASGAATFQDIEIYQFTKSGIALQATVAGTKYWKDKNLN